MSNSCHRTPKEMKIHYRVATPRWDTIINYDIEQPLIWVRRLGTHFGITVLFYIVFNFNIVQAIWCRWMWWSRLSHISRRRRAPLSSMNLCLFCWHSCIWIASRYYPLVLLCSILSCCLLNNNRYIWTEYIDMSLYSCTFNYLDTGCCNLQQ